MWKSLSLIPGKIVACFTKKVTACILPQNISLRWVAGKHLVYYSEIRFRGNFQLCFLIPWEGGLKKFESYSG